MNITKIKKLVKLGNSYAVILPKEFVKGNRKIVIEYTDNELRLTHLIPQETIIKERALFGEYGSKKKDLSKNRKKYLKDYINEKYRHR